MQQIAGQCASEAYQIFDRNEKSYDRISYCESIRFTGLNYAESADLLSVYQKTAEINTVTNV